MRLPRPYPADKPASRPKGVCPKCGRVISGRAAGVQVLAADRTFVALSPHNRGPKNAATCLPRRGRCVVPRIPAGNTQ